MKPVLQWGKGQRVITSELQCKHIKRRFEPFGLFYLQERKYFAYSSGNVFDCFGFFGMYLGREHPKSFISHYSSGK